MEGLVKCMTFTVCAHVCRHFSQAWLYNFSDSMLKDSAVVLTISDLCFVISVTHSNTHQFFGVLSQNSVGNWKTQAFYTHSMLIGVISLSRTTIA